MFKSAAVAFTNARKSFKDPRQTRLNITIRYYKNSKHLNIDALKTKLMNEKLKKTISPKIRKIS